MSNIRTSQANGGIELKSISVNTSVDEANVRWWEQSITTQFPIVHTASDGKKVTAQVGAPHAGYTIEGQLSYGVLEGPACIKSTNGLIIAEVEYIKGIAEGPCTFYYDSGITVFKGYLKNGLRQGLGKEYREDGSLLFEGYFENGQKRNIVAMKDMKGYWMELDENQNVISISQRDNDGNRYGICYEYKDGEISSVSNYENGKSNKLKEFQNNTMTEFHNNKNKAYVGGFVNKLSSGYMRAGQGTEYDENVKQIYKGYYLGGMRHGEGIGYKNGKAVYKGKWIYGKKKRTYYCQKIFVTILGAAIVALAFVFLLQYYYVGIALALLYCLMLWCTWRSKNIDRVLVIAKGKDLEMLDSQITGILVPSNSCNDVSELDLSNCSNLEYIEIGDKCFGGVQTVRICGLPKLKSIKIGRMSFTEKEENYGMNRDKSFFLVNCVELKHFEVGEWSFSDFGGEFQLTHLPNLETLTCGTLDNESFNFFGCSLLLQGFDFS